MSNLDEHDARWNKQSPITPPQKDALRPFYEVTKLLTPFMAAMLRDGQGKTPLLFSHGAIPAIRQHATSSSGDLTTEDIYGLRGLINLLPAEKRLIMLEQIAEYEVHLPGEIRFDTTSMLEQYEFATADVRLNLSRGFPATSFPRLASSARNLTLYLVCLDMQATFSHSFGRGVKIQRFLPFYISKAIADFVSKSLRNQLLVLYSIKKAQGIVPWHWQKSDYEDALRKFQAQHRIVREEAEFPDMEDLPAEVEGE